MHIFLFYSLSFCVLVSVVSQAYSRKILDLVITEHRLGPLSWGRWIVGQVGIMHVLEQFRILNCSLPLKLHYSIGGSEIQCLYYCLWVCRCPGWSLAEVIVVKVALQIFHPACRFPPFKLSDHVEFFYVKIENFYIEMIWWWFATIMLLFLGGTVGRRTYKYILWDT